MLTSTEDAHLLLNRWMSEESPLVVTLSHPGKEISILLSGLIVDVSESRLRFEGRCGVAVVCSLSLSLEEASFKYLDWREASSLSKYPVAPQAIGILEVSLPSDSRFAIYELDLHKKG